MERSISSIPGYRVYDYLLVLYPPEELVNKIQKVQKEFAEKYSSQRTNYAKPYIALATFTNLAMMEERLLQRLHITAMGLAPFKMEIKDFGSLPSHTIYLNIATRLPVQAVVKELKAAQGLMRINGGSKPHFIEDPFVTIGRKLKPWQYEQGWLEYSHRSFTGRFIADSMVLLRRDEGSKSAYRVCSRFDFQNLPVVTKQGSLFL